MYRARGTFEGAKETPPASRRWPKLRDVSAQPKRRGKPRKRLPSPSEAVERPSPDVHMTSHPVFEPSILLTTQCHITTMTRPLPCWWPTRGTLDDRVPTPVEMRFCFRVSQARLATNLKLRSLTVQVVLAPPLYQTTMQDTTD
jgi:hypothetical protein